MELRSQKVRELAPEMDPLRMGMGWKAEELSKPQIIIESTYGNSHPGSSHLNIFVEEAVKGVDENGGKAARYYATDMCDGMSQGHDGINYSLAHRDAITNLVEAQANATTFDGGVFIASGNAIAGNNGPIHDLRGPKQGGQGAFGIYAIDVSVVQQTLALQHGHISHARQIRPALQAFFHVQRFENIAMIWSGVFGERAYKSSGFQPSQTRRFFILVRTDSFHWF